MTTPWFGDLKDEDDDGKLGICTEKEPQKEPQIISPSNSFKELEQPDDEQPFKAKVLRPKQVAETISTYRKTLSGWLALLTFLALFTLYFVILISQRDMQQVSMVNNAVRASLSDKGIQGNLKPPFKADGIKDADSFWKWLDHLLTKFIFKTPPTVVKFGGKQVYTTTVNSYLDLVGGVMLVQRIGEQYECGKDFYGTTRDCYKSKRASSTLPSVLPGTEDTSQVQYSDEFKGYILFFPSGLGAQNVSQAINVFKELPGSYISNVTRKVIVRIPLYAFNVGAIGVVDVKVGFDIAGFWSIRTKHVFLPYRMYGTSWQKTRGVLEGLFLLSFTIHSFFFLRDFLKYLGLITSRPSPMCFQLELTFSRVAAALVSICIVCAQVVMWCLICLQYDEMHSEPLGQNTEEAVVNLIRELFDILDIWYWYYSLSIVNGIVITLRVFHYFHFQGKLNAITLVFSRVFLEFMNFFVVISVTILGFAFVFLLMFGSQFPELNYYGKMAAKTFYLTVGIWKPSEYEINSSHETLAFITYFFFRVLMIMMLLKMATAIIFNSYKKNRSEHDKSSGVLEDFKLMGSVMKRHYFTTEFKTTIAPDGVLVIMRHSRVAEEPVITLEELTTVVQDSSDLRQYAKRIAWLCKQYGEDSSQLEPAEGDSKQFEKFKKLFHKLAPEHVDCALGMLQGLCDTKQDASWN